MKAFVRVLFILIFFSGASGFAQEIEWQKTIGGSDVDRLTSFEQTSDGGYFCSGYSSSDISGEKTEAKMDGLDYWVIKLDSSRNIQWQKVIGGFEDDYLYSSHQTMDGGYICGGYSFSYLGGNFALMNHGVCDFWIVKLDSIGGIQWQKAIGGLAYDYLSSISQTSDGGYICGGSSNSGIGGNKTELSQGIFDYWVVKIDSVGNIQWQNTIGGNSVDYLDAIEQTSDGGYICGGTSRSTISGDKTENTIGINDYWIVKLDALGNIQWENTIGGSSNEWFYNLKQTDDGGYICGGMSNSNISGDKTENCSGSYDEWVIKLDSVGNIEWQRTIGGDFATYLIDIIQTSDKGYICGGFTEANIGGKKTEDCIGIVSIWIYKLDSLGNMSWQNTIGGDFIDHLESIKIANDGGLLCGGYSSSNVFGDKSEGCRGDDDFWIFKLTEKYNQIKGESFIDFNNDNIHNANEPGVEKKRILESTSSRIAFTNEEGKYNLIVMDTGQYQVSFSPIIPYYSVTPAFQFANFSNLYQIDSLNDFAFQSAGSYDDLCITITPQGQFRPGFNGSYKLNYKNEGTTTQSPRIVFRIFPNTSFFSSSLTPSIIYPDSVVWNLSSLSPFQTGQILVTVHLSPTIPIGTILNSYAQIFPIVNDVNPSCNNATWEVTITGSWDPNDISVDQDTLYSNVFPNPPFLDYLIRFQNTGTDTAFTVKILNPLDTMKLDLNSLEFIAASHPMEMRFIYHERNMEFLFNNILLPDSNVNEPASHGFVRYKIKPKSNLQVGDSIMNFAAIYFDFNEPVITNTAKTDILLFTGLADQISTSELFVYPNPSSQEINIQISNTQGKRICLDVYNFFGQKVKSLFDAKIMSSEFKQQFYILSLNQGMYLLQYNVDGVTKSKKIIKM